MKSLKLLSFATLSMLFLLACQDAIQDQIKPMEDTIETRANSGPKIHNFNAHFTTTLTPTSETGDCSGDFSFFNNQESPEGEMGRMARFGRFTTRVAFCFNLNTFEYIDGEGTFFMENGDELYFTIEGQVLPSDHPQYDFEFHDPFVFTGGTGEFAGASGSGVTKSLVNLLEGGGDLTDHKWKGKLVLP